MYKLRGMNSGERQRTIAMVDWTHLIEDFLDNTGISFEAFQKEMIGTWVFGYAEALRLAGVRTVFFAVSARVEAPSRFRHEPSDTDVCLLPAPRIYRATRRRVLNPYALTLESAVGEARGVSRVALNVLKHLAPYLATPLLHLGRELRREGCEAILCQEYEHARFDWAVVLGRLLRLPVFASFQGGDWRLSRFEAPIRPLTMQACSGLVIATGSEANRVRYRYRVPLQRIARIFNPVDLSGWVPAEREQSRVSLGIPPDADVVVWHGRVEVDRKGLDVLVDAWSQVCRDRAGRELRLLLVGTGQDARDLRRRIAVIPPSCVLWIDEFVHDRELLRQFLGAADLYAFASRHEGFPVAVLEAMACGLPVVACDGPAISEILEGGEDSGGVVVPPEDPNALGREIQRLLDDQALRLTLGGRARRRAELAFSPKEIGRQLSAFLLG
jgi:glycosyltransferase involved in cell wall biosynthesis